MESGSKLDVLKQLVWTTEKPQFKEPRISSTFVLQNQLYNFYFWATANWYYLKIRNESGEDVSILPCDVTVYVLESSEYLQVHTKNSSASSSIWSCDFTKLSNYISGFYQKRFMRFKITFHCDPGSLHILSVTGDKSVQTSSTFHNRPCLESISLDYSKLLDGHKYISPDVELRCGTASVQAHKSVLGARSEVFAAMLQSDMLEGQTGQVEVKDIHEEIFREFITYLYSGTLPELTIDKALAFYEAADKYAVRGLMRRCAIFLTENMRPENAWDALGIADAHGDKEFKEKVMSYILDKNIPLDEEHWPTFSVSHPTLVIEMLHRGFKLCCPK